MQRERSTRRIYSRGKKSLVRRDLHFSSFLCDSDVDRQGFRKNGTTFHGKCFLHIFPFVGILDGVEWCASECFDSHRGLRAAIEFVYMLGCVCELSTINSSPHDCSKHFAQIWKRSISIKVQLKLRFKSPRSENAWLDTAAAVISVLCFMQIAYFNLENTPEAPSAAVPHVAFHGINSLAAAPGKQCSDNRASSSRRGTKTLSKLHPKIQQNVPKSHELRCRARSRQNKSWWTNLTNLSRFMDERQQPSQLISWERLHSGMQSNGKPENFIKNLFKLNATHVQLGGKSRA